MRGFDVNVPVGDEEYARVCRAVVNTCIRTTEESEHVDNVRRGKGRCEYTFVKRTYSSF